MSDVIDNEAVLEAAEKSIEAIEEGLDNIEEGLKVVRNNPVVLAVVGVLGVAAGAAGGYFLAKKRLEAFYEEVSRSEIAQAKEFYAGIYKTDEDGAVLTPQEVLMQRHGAEAAEAVRSYRGEPEGKLSGTLKSPHELDDEMDEAQIRKIEKARIHSVSVDAEPGPHGGTIEVVEKTETRNVFEDPTFDLEEEMKHRTEDKPYIITHDEFYEAEKDYETSSLTYFEADDTLVDERDQPIREIDKTIGEDHLVRFGTASKDKNIVYIRNDRLEIDYEVTKSTGSYVEEVLGMLDSDETTLQHSNRNAQQRRRREFRHGDG